jgi:hypothetical protein
MTVLNYQIPADTHAVERTQKRKPTVAGAVANINRYVDQRLGEAAASLSRGAIAAARIQLVNEAMTGLGVLIYETDAAGFPVNVDGATGRVLVPKPWGGAGWKYWKLRQWEGRVLRRVLDRRMRAGERVALFLYDGAMNDWLLNKRYDTPTKYAAYWQQQPITPAEWRLCDE